MVRSPCVATSWFVRRSSMSHPNAPSLTLLPPQPFLIPGTDIAGAARRCDAWCQLPATPTLAQPLVSALPFAGIGHHLAVFATFLPFLPAITRNVKFVIRSTRLESSISGKSHVATLPKSGKNGNVFRYPSNELSRIVTHPAPALAPTSHSWASMPPSPLSSRSRPRPFASLYKRSLPFSVFLCDLCDLCGCSRSPPRPPRPPR